MKTTLDLPGDLVRKMKLRAVQEGRKLKDVAAEVFRRGLTESAVPQTARHRVKLPLIKCRQPAMPARELTADKVAKILLKQEADWSHDTARR